MSDDEQKVATEEAVTAADNQSESRQASTHSKNNKTSYITAAIVVAAVLIIGGLEYAGVTNFAKADQVVATVNGANIHQSEIDTRLEETLGGPAGLEALGLDANTRAQMEAQIIDELINTELLMQQVRDADITTSTEDIQREVDALITQLGGEEIFNQRLEEIGLRRETLEENIERTLLIEQYIDSQATDEDLLVSDEEIQELYDQFAASQEDAPALDEVRAQIEESVVGVKRQQIVATIIEDLRAAADISVAE